MASNRFPRRDRHVNFSVDVPKHVGGTPGSASLVLRGEVVASVIFSVSLRHLRCAFVQSLCSPPVPCAAVAREK